MWYVVVSSTVVELDLTPENGRQLCRFGEMIKVATREQFPVNHPEYDYPGADILVFRGPAPPGSSSDARNAVVMSNNDLDWNRPSTWTGMLDRSPCGTGTCAVMATMYARGELQLGEKFVHESIIGSQFVGELVEETIVAAGTEFERMAVRPRISGQAWVTQISQVLCHPSDPFPEGYTVGDIW